MATLLFLSYRLRYVHTFSILMCLHYKQNKGNQCSTFLVCYLMHDHVILLLVKPRQPHEPDPLDKQLVMIYFSHQKTCFHCCMSMIRCATFIVYGIPSSNGCSAFVYVHCFLCHSPSYLTSVQRCIQRPGCYIVLLYLTMYAYICQRMLHCI